jgi:hypothetical protein
MVPYTGHPDSGEIVVEPEELGRISQVEWVADIDEARQALMEQVGL